MRRQLTGLVMVLAVGCAGAGEDTVVPTSADATNSVDAGVGPDAGAQDAGSGSGAADAAVGLDAGAQDAGSAAEDAAVGPDAGAQDAGSGSGAADAATVVLVGNTTIEPVEDYETVGDADAFEYTSGAHAGRATQINVYAAASNQATALQVALYADSAGVPEAMLAGSSCTISMPAGVAGWFGCALSNGPMLSPNTKYWMAALSTSGEFHWRGRDGSHGRYSYSASQTSLPATWTQTGTYAGYSRSAYVEGAVTGATFGSAQLSWDAPTTFVDGSPLTDLTGYRIYYGTSSGSYPTTVSVSNPAAVSYTIGDLPGGATYYFVVTALSASGGESAPSIEASKTIP
ncbi:MAG: fibronectin type III domain-containing protein [Deltaproteobacteria bacterium]|nr:fibronectin type III domain-containing protein [Deltaproteobacteria bacterium]